jgi:hypothetical protein
LQLEHKLKMQTTSQVTNLGAAGEWIDEVQSKSKRSSEISRFRRRAHFGHGTA